MIEPRYASFSAFICREASGLLAMRTKEGHCPYALCNAGNLEVEMHSVDSFHREPHVMARDLGLKRSARSLSCIRIASNFDEARRMTTGMRVYELVEAVVSRNLRLQKRR
jgi:hypothetical protein